MNDEDIQYLGTRSPLSTGPLTPGRQQRDFVSGFILHVEKSANESENKLTFWRSDHSVIHIGRRPANPTPADSVGSSDNAMFRCAVVSRKHAKIVFSDSGTVYIVDTNSHHGTHILKADSTSAASKQIPSETPTQLSNGDIITFGKTVGRSNEFVTPIVIRVELMYAPPLFSRPVGTTTPMRQTSNQDKTIDLTLLSTPPPTISPLFRHPPTAIPSPIPMRRTGSNSGRYGLNLDLSPLEISSASSSESDDSEDRGGERDMSPDSDIEELPSSSSIAMHHNSTPASGPNALPILRPRVPSFGSGRSLDDALESIAQAEVAPAPAPEESHSRIHRAFEIFEVLKNLIPPVNIPGVGPSTELAAPPSPPHELMARQRTMNESSHDDVADESIQQAQQLSLDASLYRPHTPISQASSSSSLAPLKLHIEPISRPAGPDFPRNSEQQGPMFDLFDAPGSPLEASPICSFSPYSPRSLSNNLPSPPLQPSISPMHTPPPDFLNPSCLGSLQPDSIFTQGFLDKEKQRQRDLARDIVEEQSQRIHPWTFTPSPISRSPSPDMRDGEYERFEDPDADFVPFPCVSEIAFFGDFSSQASNASSRLSYEDNTHGEVVQEKEREGSPMELESVDGENLHAMPARDVSSEAANKAQKRLTLSERLRLEREELERRLKTFRRITTDEDNEQDVVPEAAPEQEEQEEEAPASSCVEVPVAAPSLTPNKAMSLDSICSSDVAAIPPAQAPAAEPVQEEPAGFPEVDALKGQIRQLQDDIQKAQTQQRRTKARVARSLRVQSERVTDLDDKVDDVVKQCLSVTERVDNVMDTDMPDLVGQVEQLREMLESKTSAALQDVLEKNHDGLEKERKDIMEHVEMLKSLVDEMRELKEYSEEQMKAELDAIRLAKEEAIKTIAAHVEGQLALTPSPASITASTTTMQPVSLKRKRNDDGEDDEGGENEAGDEGASVDDDEMNDEEEHGSLFQAPSLIPDHELPQPPRKRIRRVAATAAKTATAVTVGAIAAWSALAFT